MNMTDCFFLDFLFPFHMRKMTFFHTCCFPQNRPLGWKTDHMTCFLLLKCCEKDKMDNSLAVTAVQKKQEKLRKKNFPVFFQCFSLTDMGSSGYFLVMIYIDFLNFVLQGTCGHSEKGGDNLWATAKLRSSPGRMSTFGDFTSAPDQTKLFGP